MYVNDFDRIQTLENESCMRFCQELPNKYNNNHLE